MIGFPENFKTNDDEDFLAKSLQEILDSLYLQEEEGEEDIKNLSELIDIVYTKLFLDSNKKITLTIEKNANNSLKINIDNLR
jgi:hypothetical protein